VSADSKDRGMSSRFWTPLALVPPGLGPLVYLLFRVPKAVACSRCGKGVRAGSSYCTSCGEPMGAVCPHCRRTIGPDDSFCAHCGRELAVASDGPSAARMDQSHH
jgi:predicted amidophosphoribosyltransferase